MLETMPMDAPERTTRLRSTLTCPECGGRKQETMPENACIRRYECTHCGKLLAPLHGDCCVFCSFADAPCPPVQKGDCC